MEPLRFATLDDIDELANLYLDTICTINIKDYTQEQVTAWAGRSNDMERWKGRVNDQFFLIAHKDNSITGFSSLTQSGHLDLLFVHKDYQGQGIARRLLAEIEAIAIAQNFELITTDASITARPVFERMGYKVVSLQSVVVDGVELTNFKMQKRLK